MEWPNRFPNLNEQEAQLTTYQLEARIHTFERQEARVRRILANSGRDYHAVLGDMAGLLAEKYFNLDAAAAREEIHFREIGYVY